MENFINVFYSYAISRWIGKMGTNEMCKRSRVRSNKQGLLHLILLLLRLFLSLYLCANYCTQQGFTLHSTHSATGSVNADTYNNVFCMQLFLPFDALLLYTVAPLTYVYRYLPFPSSKLQQRSQHSPKIL